MTRPYLRERRAQRIAEGQRDMGCRCAFCKRVKPLRLGAFCSFDCERDAAEAEEQRKLMEARR